MSRRATALDELHRQEVDAVRFLDRIDRDDVRMVEGGDGAGFALEAGEPLGIIAPFHPGALQRDSAPEPGVAGSVVSFLECAGAPPPARGRRPMPPAPSTPVTSNQPRRVPTGTGMGPEVYTVGR